MWKTVEALFLNEYSEVSDEISMTRTGIKRLTIYLDYNELQLVVVEKMASPFSIQCCVRNILSRLKFPFVRGSSVEKFQLVAG